jgi:hypothetical protein
MKATVKVSVCSNPYKIEKTHHDNGSLYYTLYICGNNHKAALRFAESNDNAKSFAVYNKNGNTFDYGELNLPINQYTSDDEFGQIVHEYRKSKGWE